MNYHSQTEHSYNSVRMNSGFLDWATQPSAFKTYPKFYPRFKLDATKKLDKIVLLSGKITYEKKYSKDDTYFLRVQPSAGALYPTELYVQIRSLEGYVDGIYHFDVQSEALILLHELNGDGIEGVAGLDYSVNGALFLFSSPYFRSSWKYKNRAFRYCLLDTGHCYGALEFASYANDEDVEAIFEFDKIALSKFMGFENKEFALMLAVCGEKIAKIPRKPSENLPFVSATDYFEQNVFIEDAYKESISLQSPKKAAKRPNFALQKERLLASIESRRSIRAFYKQPITKNEFLEILMVAGEPINSEPSEELEIFIVVNNVEGMQNGVYKGSNLIKAGDFSAESKYLCLEQALGGQSSATIFISCAFNSYQTAGISAGIYGHRVYIAANMLGIGTSGIGAYYDKEVKEFLQTDNHILYALAVGR